jgi:hypothetical protein
MNVARLATAPLAILLFAVEGCSDPPSPPAQAAVAVKVAPTNGKQCPSSGSFLTMPALDSNNQPVIASVLGQLTQCDLSMGCKPDKYVVVDRDRGAVVSCQVSPTAAGFNVLLSLDVDGSAVGMGAPSMRFDMSGSVSTGGGMASITENNSAYGGGGSDAACTVTMPGNQSAVKKGSIWATFSCPTFRDQSDIADTQCLAQGAFLFENCSG